VLPRVAPELDEWAAFFAATASRRAAVEAGRGDAIGSRDADDLLRDAERLAALHALAPSGARAAASVPMWATLPKPVQDCYAGLSATA